MFRAMSAGKEHIIQTQKLNTDYSGGNKSTNQFYHEGGSRSMQTATATDKEAVTFTRRIGSTVYRVGVHFSRTSKETMHDKITRLVKNEAVKR